MSGIAQDCWRFTFVIHKYEMTPLTSPGSFRQLRHGAAATRTGRGSKRGLRSRVQRRRGQEDHRHGAGFRSGNPSSSIDGGRCRNRFAYPPRTTFLRRALRSGMISRRSRSTTTASAEIATASGRDGAGGSQFASGTSHRCAAVGRRRGSSGQSPDGWRWRHAIPQRSQAEEQEARPGRSTHARGADVRRDAVAHGMEGRGPEASPDALRPRGLGLGRRPPQPRAGESTRRIRRPPRRPAKNLRRSSRRDGRESPANGEPASGRPRPPAPLPNTPGLNTREMGPTADRVRLRLI